MPVFPSGLPSFLSCRIKSLYSDEVSEPHSGRICRTDRPSGDKTMGGHGENDQPRRQSLQLSLFVFPAKNEGKLECLTRIQRVQHRDIVVENAHMVGWRTRLGFLV